MALVQTATTRVMPLVTRVLIVAVLLPLGWRLAFTQVRFTPAESAQLAALGVNASGVDFARVRSGLPGSGDAQQPASGTPAGSAAGAPAPAMGEGRSLYRIALVADAAQLPAPALAGWIAATMLLGGSVLIGLGAFTRLVAALLALVSATAFWADCLPPLRGGWWSADDAALIHAGAHAALFLLCGFLVLLGGGSLSVDGLLAGRPAGRRSGGGSGARSGGAEGRGADRGKE